MSLCINPHCPQPNHPDNQTHQVCQSCGSALILEERYRVMRLLSDRSGFGYVYEAFESNVPKILKVLKESHNNNIKAVELFEQEARVLGQLNHPGIPKIDVSGCFQFRPTPDGPLLHCIVMEKIDGPNLREWMTQQGNHPLNTALALNWLTQLTSILHLVHQHSYFHRDIKPENIMLRASGDLVLVDFGAAREMTCTYFARLEEAEGITRVSSTGYTPPEQERGRAVPQSDFYALGCTIMFLLTGRRPMEPGIYDGLTNEFCWRQYAPQVPPALANLVDQLTAARAVDRPQNTQVLLQQLFRIQADLSADMSADVSADVSAIEAEGLGSKARNSQAMSPQMIQPLGQAKAIDLPNQSASSAATEPPQVLPPYTVVQKNTALQNGGQGSGQRATAQSVEQRRPDLLAAGLAGLCIAGTIAAGAAVFRWQTASVPGENQSQAAPFSGLTTFEGHSGKVNDLALSLNQTVLASGSDDQTVKLWDVESGEERRSLPRHSDRVQAVAFSPDGKLVISGSGSGEVLVWDAVTGTLLSSLTGHSSAINDLVVSSDGNILGSASADRTIRLWDLAQSELIDVLEGHRSYVNAIAFSPDGKTIISGAADRTIRIWGLDTGESSTLSQHDTYINDIAISPDGNLLASAGADDEIVLWDLATQTPSGQLVGHTGYVNALIISPDGKTLISSSADSTVNVWNLEDKALLYSIPWNNTLVNTVAVRFGNPYWQIMAGGKGSTTIKAWRAE